MELSTSETELELNGTYTVETGLSSPNLDVVGDHQHTDHHIVHIPITPRDVDTGNPRLPLPPLG